MNGDNSNAGLILGAILLGGSLLKKKKAEAELAKAMEEKPPLAVVPQVLVKAQDEGIPSTVPQVPLVAQVNVQNPEPVIPVLPTLAPEIPPTSGLITQKIKELAQSQIVPSTKAVTTPEVPVVTTTVTKTPTTEVIIPEPVPIISTAPTPLPAVTIPVQPEQIITLSDATQPFIAEIDRTVIPVDAAIGSWLSKQFKSVEKHVRKEFKRVTGKIGAELKRTEQHIRKELKRTEQHIRHELRRFEIRIRKNLSAIATVLSIVGYIFPAVKLAAYALDAVTTYRTYAQAKALQKKIEGQERYVAEVQAEAKTILDYPKTLATKEKGGVLGYLFKNRINSSFVPLISINNPDLNDVFYTTIDMIPVLNAASYTPGNTVGFICKIPFSGSSPLKLMYSFELMDFVTVTGGSGYYAELVKNGYVEVKQLGYVSKKPQEGPFTSNEPLSVERIEYK